GRLRRRTGAQARSGRTKDETHATGHGTPACAVACRFAHYWHELTQVGAVLVLPSGQWPAAIAFKQTVLQTWVAVMRQSLRGEEHTSSQISPVGDVHMQITGAAQRFGSPALPQVSGAGQVPQVPPQPSSPHSLSKQFGVQPIVVVVELVVVV